MKEMLGKMHYKKRGMAYGGRGGGIRT